MSLSIINITSVSITLGFNLPLCGGGVLLYKSSVPSAVNVCSPPSTCDLLCGYIYLSGGVTQYIDINVTPTNRYYYRLSDPTGAFWVSQALVVTIPAPMQLGLASAMSAGCIDANSTYALVVAINNVTGVSTQVNNYLITLAPPATPVTPNPFATFSAFVTINGIDIISVAFAAGYPAAVGSGNINAANQTAFIYLVNLPIALSASRIVNVLQVSATGAPIGSMVSATIPTPVSPTPPGTCLALFTA